MQGFLSILTILSEGLGGHGRSDVLLTGHHKNISDFRRRALKY